MASFCKRIAQARWFHSLNLIVIVGASVLVGIETYAAFSERHAVLLGFLNQLVLGIFVVEAAIKMAQYGKDWTKYFKDPWNLFDFTIVVVCFLPVNASYAAVLRLARILRALRLMTALPQLQVIVGALIKSIPSMGYVGILLVLNFYVYAVMGVFMFAENDPVHFRDLPTAMLSLFRVVTLEDWTDVMYIQMYGSDVYEYVNTTAITPKPSASPIMGALFFVSFVMFGTMIMLNLFIGVILNSMDQARNERVLDEKQAVVAELPVTDQIQEIEAQLDAMKESLQVLQRRLKPKAG